jgi:hypothetical protein
MHNNQRYDDLTRGPAPHVSEPVELRLMYIHDNLGSPKMRSIYSDAADEIKMLRKVVDQRIGIYVDACNEIERLKGIIDGHSS